ncbi:PREDICTED: prostaglandin E synthase [Thamnophis sirtalis]|uniref:Prostaglandin E synthase n=1 Tax=Thamnophis sirtalis TaxID=35019 RepID=A0A6I9XAZ5_9SAUR|nr:PREDICTED: prostaglandin E synthase [Thamnophis sirtalis]
MGPGVLSRHARCTRIHTPPPIDTQLLGGGRGHAQLARLPQKSFASQPRSASSCDWLNVLLGCSLSSSSSGPFQAFANPEDALKHGGLEFHREDPYVQRCLRVHRNDVETIFPFLFIGAVYSFLHPSPVVARIHFLIFFLGRMLHTVAYLLPLRPPTRSVAYSVAQIPCFSMALQILVSVIRH